MVEQKPRLRWFQFRLQTALLLLTLICLLSGWLAVKARQAVRQRQMVEEIKKLGGSVVYDWQLDAQGLWLPGAHVPGPKWLRSLLGDDFFQSVSNVGLDRAADSDSGLKYVEGLSQLQRLSVDTRVTDAGLEHLKGLGHLRELTLDGAQITDAGLEHLKGLANLQALYISNTQITDAGLARLKGSSNLRRLAIGNTRITDAGLEHLKNLSDLRELSLENTQINDAGLENLKALSHLEELYLRGTNVTYAGVNELQQALPKCEIFP
jgi:hypothetical protein